MTNQPNLEPAPGVKPRRTTSNGDPDLFFKDWKRTLGDCPSMDIDHLEYRYSNGIYRIVGILEFTSARLLPVRQKCKDDALARIFKPGAQGGVLQLLASTFNVPARIVLHSEDWSEIWVCDVMHPENGWHQRSMDQFARWIRGL